MADRIKHSVRDDITLYLFVRNSHLLIIYWYHQLMVIIFTQKVYLIVVVIAVENWFDKLDVLFQCCGLRNINMYIRNKIKKNIYI